MINWITSAGDLANIIERITVDIELTATSNIGNVSYEIIAGHLPRGLRLIGNRIKGSPVEVRRYTESRFVVRASDGQDLEDRTFNISVDGSDIPQWITREDFLNIGAGKSYFVLDNAYVNFHLEAIDPDINAGDNLEFYLSPMGGDLPPGLSLSRDGVISGFTDPIFALENRSQVTGYYDTSGYDIVPLDIVAARTNGFDSFFYDNVTYDYNEPNSAPRRLSRFYTFVVVVSDGSNEVRRVFKIWVVTDEFLKADNSIVQVDTTLFLADSTSNRVPLWITESYLGRVRADNYVTIYLDVYDPPTLAGTITYFLLDKNPDGSDSVIPPGMVLDTVTGEIAGRVSYQRAVTKPYTFTMLAVDFPATLADSDYTLVGDWDPTRIYRLNEAVRYAGFIYIAIQVNRGVLPLDGPIWNLGVATSEKTFTVDLIGEIDSSIEWISEEEIGIIKPNQPSTLFVSANSLLYGNKVVYEFISGRLPPGLELISDGIIKGKVKQFADSNGPGLTRIYDKNMLISNLIGSIDVNAVITGQDSGAKAKILNIRPASNQIYYDLYRIDTDSELNEVLIRDRNSVDFIEGEPITIGTAFATVESSNLEFTTTLDFGSSTLDRKFVFNVKARDTANFAEDIKQFYIQVTADDTKTYANLYFKAFQSKEKRLNWYDFITDNNIFRLPEIYRYGDANFGVQSELKVLLFAGIESVKAVNYVQAMSRNHYRKQLRFGDVKYAVAKDPDTQLPVYEVVYVEIADEYEKNGKSISKTVEFKDTIESKILLSYSTIKVDSDVPLVSQQDHQRIFPNSFKNMRSRIREVGQRDREFLPLWMRSIQPASFVETGFVKAQVLCFLKPGNSEATISRIKSDGFDFKSIDFTVDRYVIDILDGEIENKYLAFPQRDALNKLEGPSSPVDVTPIIIGTFDNNLILFDNDSITFDQG